MLLPFKAMVISAQTTCTVEARPTQPCRPIRLLLGWECAKSLLIQDIKIGNRSYVQSMGEVPGIHFHEFAYKPLKDADDEITDELATIPDLDLGIATFNQPIILHLKNNHPAAIPFSGAWECKPATEPEILEASTSPYQKEVLNKYDRALVILEELAKRQIMK